MGILNQDWVLKGSPKGACPLIVVPVQGDPCTTVIPAKAGIQGDVGPAYTNSP